VSDISITLLERLALRSVSVYLIIRASAAIGLGFEVVPGDLEVAHLSKLVIRMDHNLRLVSALPRRQVRLWA
jgi:hypothetical protein